MNVHVPTKRGWYDSDIEALTDYWGKGFSASQIAGIMDRSRNSILGAVHRLNLPARAILHRKAIAPYTRKERTPRSTSERTKPRLVSVNLAIPKAKLWDPLDNCPPIRLLDRERKQCAWPLDIDTEIGEKLVCGEPIWGSCAYCGAHKRAAYDPRKKSGHFKLNSRTAI